MVNYWICFLIHVIYTVGPSNISGEISREQSTVQQQSASSNPEPAREIPAEQPTQVDGRRHEVIPANREGDLATNNIPAQGSEINSSQVNSDQGTYKKLYPHLAALFDFPKSKRAYC